MSSKRHTTLFVRFDDELCIGCGACLRICPTKAIRIRSRKSIRIVDQCIGCGACLRACPSGAVTALTQGQGPELLPEDRIAVALVSPVVYAQFPGIMPKDILQGLRRLGFHHTIDMVYFLEMFQYATEEYIRRNRASGKSPWPLFSPVCPVVVRLIAFQFPSLMPHVLPVLRPVALMKREVRERIVPQYRQQGKQVVLYYINPCPTKIDPQRHSPSGGNHPAEIAVGINEIYPALKKQVELIVDSDEISYSDVRFDYETGAAGNASMWGMSGGEIADLDIDRSVAVSGLKETIRYLEKIELGLFRDLEYIEFRTCREGCLGGVLTVMDKYLAKSYAHKMIREFGQTKNLPKEKILRLYEKGLFRFDNEPDKLMRLFGTRKSTLTLEAMQQIEDTLMRIRGNDCAGCGAPDCRTFAEDVTRGTASLDECRCAVPRRRKKKPPG